jgi:hypothetical protein
MYIEETGFYTCKECHKTESLRNHTATTHKERERLGDRRIAGENSCNSGDGRGPNGPTLDVYDDDDFNIFQSFPAVFRTKTLYAPLHIPIHSTSAM